MRFICVSFHLIFRKPWKDSCSYIFCNSYIVKRQPSAIITGYYWYLNICICNLQYCYEQPRQNKKEENLDIGYYKKVIKNITPYLVKVHVIANSCKCVTFLLTVHGWNPPPLIKGRVGPSKNWVTWRGTKFFARNGG